MKSKQIILKLFIALLFVGIHTSCEKENESENDYAPLIRPIVTSEVNWIGHWLNEGNKVDLVKNIAREYEFLNQEVLVNLKFPEELYDENTQAEIDFIVEQLQKETPDWDIIRLYGNYEEIGIQLNNPNWEEKYLVDFSSVPGFIESHKNFIKTASYKERNDNRFYGPHIEGQLAALFVNTKVAEKIGIKVKQFDMTFDDFLRYIKAVHHYNENHDDIVPIFEYNWGKTTTIFNMLFYSLMDSKDEALSTVLTEKKLEAIEKCFMALEELSAFNPIEKDWWEHDWAVENNRILNGECLFFPNLTLMYGIWNKDNADLLKDVMPCEFPVFKPSPVYIGGYLSNWAVLKKSPNKDRAIELMMQMCKPDVAEQWGRLSKSPSGIKGSLTGSIFGFDPFETYTYSLEKKYETMVKDEDKAYIMGQKNTHINLPIQDILLKNITAKDAFETFKTQVILY